MTMPTKIGDFTFLSVTEAGERMGCTVSYVRRLCREGRLKGAIRHGQRSWLVPEQAAKQVSKELTTRSVGKRKAEPPSKN